MGLIKAFKKRKIKSIVLKNKRTNIFDKDTADNIKEDLDEHSIIFTTPDSKFVWLRCVETINERPEFWFLFQDSDGEIYVEHKSKMSKSLTSNIKIEVVKSGAEINFEFDGLVKRAEKTDNGYLAGELAESKPFQMRAKFVSSNSAFEMTRSISSETIATALCKEKQNKKFYSTLNSLFSASFQQIGKLDLTLNSKDKETKFIGIRTIRNRKFTKNEDSKVPHEIRIVFNTEEGNYVSVTKIKDAPINNFISGYCRNGDKIKSVLKINNLDGLISDFENINKYNFSIEFVDGEIMNVKAEKLFFGHYISGDSKIYLGRCNFDVDSKKASGIMELIQHE